MAQSLFSSWRRPRNFWKRFPLLLHKYGTQNTYECTWDILAPFTANRRGGAGGTPSPPLLYPLWGRGVWTKPAGPASLVRKGGWKSPADLRPESVQGVPRSTQNRLRTGGWGLKRRLLKLRGDDRRRKKERWLTWDTGSFKTTLKTRPIIWHMVHSLRKWLEHDFFTWIIFFWQLRCQTRTSSSKLYKKNRSMPFWKFFSGYFLRLKGFFEDPLYLPDNWKIHDLKCEKLQFYFWNSILITIRMHFSHSCAANKWK